MNTRIDWLFLHGSMIEDAVGFKTAQALVSAMRLTDLTDKVILGVAYDFWTHGLYVKAENLVKEVMKSHSAQSIWEIRQELYGELDSENPEDRDEFMALLERCGVKEPQ